MRNLSIKWQMGLVAALATLGMLLSTVLQQYSLGHLKSLQEARIQISDIESGMLTLRRNEKDFLARHNQKYVDQFNDQYASTQGIMVALKGILEKSELNQAITQELSSILSDYQKAFLALVELQKQIGLDHKQGLYGALREAVHKAEDLIKAQHQDKLFKDMLLLHRSEKDFMLRLDLQYVEKFDKDMALLQQDIAVVDMAADEREAILAGINTYETDFKALVNASVKLGLSSEEGILGDMRKTIHQSEALLAQLRKDTGQLIDAEAGSQGLNAMMLSTVLTLAILGLIAYVAPGVIRPVNQLALLMLRASKDWDMTARANDTGPQEVAVMAQAFNKMMSAFQEMIIQIVDLSSHLNLAADQLGKVISNANDGFSRQQSDTEQVATAMNEMTATVQEVARHASSAADASEAADNEARKGHGVVEQTKDEIHSLANEVMSAAKVISDLSKESENIGTVLSVIRGIADQTNLLALNAAIEAARAGEQGRGFAVVADEVRTLAKRSQESTEEIQAIVERLQQAAERAVLAMDRGSDKAQGSVERSQVAAESLEAILNAVSVIKGMNLQIATAVEQQAAVSEEINRNIVNISDITKDTSANTLQTMETGNSLSTMAAQLKELVVRFKVA